MHIDEYEIGDEVDVFADTNDIFTDFSGRIVKINYDTRLITVKDQDDDCWDAEVNQIRLTYSEELEIN